MLRGELSLGGGGSLGPELRTPRKTQVAGISREKGVGEGKKKKARKKSPCALIRAVFLGKYDHVGAGEPMSCGEKAGKIITCLDCSVSR